MVMRAVRFYVGMAAVRRDDVPVLTDSGGVVHSSPFPIVTARVLECACPIVETDMLGFCSSRRYVLPRSATYGQLVKGMPHNPILGLDIEGVHAHRLRTWRRCLPAVRAAALQVRGAAWNRATSAAGFSTSTISL